MRRQPQQIVASATLVLMACQRTPHPVGVHGEVPGATSAGAEDASVSGAPVRDAEFAKSREADAPSGPDAKASFVGSPPLAVPTAPFIFHAYWPECVHPGVSADCKDSWCRIPAGCYIFGSPEDTPGRAAYGEDQGPITLTYEMEVMQYALTWAQWDEMGWPRKVYDGDCDDDQCPAGMSWFEGMLYANRLSEAHDPPLETCYDLGPTCWRDPGDRMECPDYDYKVPGFECPGYRIPNHFEWQYIARAGTSTDFYAGPITVPGLSDCSPEPSLHEIAWYCGNSEGHAAHPVGQLLPNAWGLYDILGNRVEMLATPERVSPPYPAVDPPEQHMLGQRRSEAAGGNIIDSPIIVRPASHLPGDFAGLRLVRTLGPGTVPTLKDVSAPPTAH